MTCKTLQQAIFLHAHGQLGPLEGRLVERHLGGCPACREEWQRASREAADLRSVLGPAVGSAQGIRLTPAQLLAARGERLVNGRKAPGGEAGSWRPAGWARHFGGRFERSAGRGGGRWLPLLIAAALLACGFAAAATLGPPSNFVRRCLGLPQRDDSCPMPGTSAGPNGPRMIPMAPPPGSGIQAPGQPSPLSPPRP